MAQNIPTFNNSMNIDEWNDESSIMSPCTDLLVSTPNAAATPSSLAGDSVGADTVM